jgi:hypothetical protein
VDSTIIHIISTEYGVLSIDYCLLRTKTSLGQSGVERELECDSKVPATKSDVPGCQTCSELATRRGVTGYLANKVRGTRPSRGDISRPYLFTYPVTGHRSLLLY